MGAGVAGLSEAAGVGVGVGVGGVIGMVIGVADGDAPPAVATGGGMAVMIGMRATEADGAGDRPTPVATTLGEGAAARSAAEEPAGTAMAACVHAVSARIAIERIRIKFHMRRT